MARIKTVNILIEWPLPTCPITDQCSLRSVRCFHSNLWLIVEVTVKITRSIVKIRLLIVFISIHENRMATRTDNQRILSRRLTNSGIKRSRTLHLILSVRVKVLGMNIRWFLRNGLCRRSNNYCTTHPSTIEEHCNPITKLCIWAGASFRHSFLHQMLQSMHYRIQIDPMPWQRCHYTRVPSLNNNIIMSEFNCLRTTCIVPWQNSSSVRCVCVIRTKHCANASDKSRYAPH